MEKKVKNSYSFGPWTMKQAEKDSFVQVTFENRPQAIVYGRILYIISGLTFRGSFSVDPNFEKGWIHYPFKPWMSKTQTHYKVFISEETEQHVYAMNYKKLIDSFIEEKSLYLKPSDPILTYRKE